MKQKESDWADLLALSIRSSLMTESKNEGHNNDNKIDSAQRAIGQRIKNGETGRNKALTELQVDTIDRQGRGAHRVREGDHMFGGNHKHAIDK